MAAGSSSGVRWTLPALLLAFVALVLLGLAVFPGADASSAAQVRVQGEVVQPVTSGDAAAQKRGGKRNVQRETAPAGRASKVEKKVTRIIEIVPEQRVTDDSGGGEPVAATPPKPSQPAPPQVGAAASELPRFPSAARELSCKACFRHGAQMGDRLCLPSACVAFPATGRKVVSTSLYGADVRYTSGAIRNGELAAIVMPGWLLRFYLKDDVPMSVREELVELGVDVVVLQDTKSLGFGMNWRFLAAQDASVTAFLSRDCDSRLSLRDRYAAEAWMASRKPFHIVRDHPSHAGYPLMGGTWGARNSIWGPPPGGSGTDLQALLGEFVGKHGEGGYMSDMDFLHSSVWPLMQTHGNAQHDSHSCSKYGPGGGPWPRPRAGLEHVGAVYLWDGAGHEKAREGDCALLNNNWGTAECASPPFPSSGRKAWRLPTARESSHRVPLDALLPCPLGGDEVTGHDGDGLYGCSVGWRQATGMCSGEGRAAVLHWRDAFVDGDLGTHSAVFTYSAHTFVGVGASSPLPPPPLAYHERVPPSLEPIQAYDGGVRYYTSLALVDGGWAYGSPGGGGLAAAASTFAREDLPRLLQLVPGETVVLLPALAAAAVRTALAGMTGEDVPSPVAHQFSPSALARHVVEQQSGSGVLHYARDVFVYGCAGDE